MHYYIFKSWILPLFLLPLSLSGGTAVRFLSHSVSSSGSILQVILEVTGDSASIEPCIIEENWPQGTELLSSHWNGHPVENYPMNGAFRWLIGWNDGLTDTGFLHYVIRLPELSESSLSISGVIQHYGTSESIGGTSMLQLDDILRSSPLSIALSRGWNLLSLPGTLSEFNQKLLAYAEDGPPLFTELQPAFSIYSVDSIPSGVPFWLHLRNEVPSLTMPLSDEEIDGASAVTHSADASILSSGWRLIGVAGSTSIPRPETTYPIWKWQDGKYIQHQGPLQAGAGYWVHAPIDKSGNNTLLEE